MLIISIFFLPCRTSIDCGFLRHIAAFLILLIWSKYALVVAASLPALCWDRYLQMLGKVCINVSMHCWFYQLGSAHIYPGNGLLHDFHRRLFNGLLPHTAAGLQKDNNARKIYSLKKMPPDASVSFVGYEAKEHYDFFFFNAPLTAFFKTLGMFVGEIEFADLPIDASSKLSFLTYSFLAVFVFVIGIVQMNLLNGLAVNDVGELQKNAEIRSIKARCTTPPPTPPSIS